MATTRRWNHRGQILKMVGIRYVSAENAIEDDAYIMSNQIYVYDAQATYCKEKIAFSL